MGCVQRYFGAFARAVAECDGIECENTPDSGELLAIVAEEAECVWPTSMRFFGVACECARIVGILERSFSRASKSDCACRDTPTRSWQRIVASVSNGYRS